MKAKLILTDNSHMDTFSIGTAALAVKEIDFEGDHIDGYNDNGMFRVTVYTMVDVPDTFLKSPDGTIPTYKQQKVIKYLQVPTYRVVELSVEG